jgi:intracellular sulfur oxidation DsrE/DsrF family protein
MWAKYGAPLAKRIEFNDPKTQAAPTINVLQSTQYGMQLPNRGTTLDAMIKRGTHFAVCDMATRAFAGIIAGAGLGKTEEIYTELKANSIANCHYMSAGIVAVNRAQERGYSLCQLG